MRGNSGYFKDRKSYSMPELKRTTQMTDSVNNAISVMIAIFAKLTLLFGAARPPVLLRMSGLDVSIGEPMLEPKAMLVILARKIPLWGPC